MMAPLAVIQAIRDRPRSSCSSIAVNQVCICVMLMMMPYSMYDDDAVCHIVCMFDDPCMYDDDDAVCHVVCMYDDAVI